MSVPFTSWALVSYSPLTSPVISKAAKGIHLPGVFWDLGPHYVVHTPHSPGRICKLVISFSSSVTPPRRASSYWLLCSLPTWLCELFFTVLVVEEPFTSHWSDLAAAVFRESCSTCRYIFYLLMRGGEGSVLLLLHLFPSLFVSFPTTKYIALEVNDWE